MPKREFDVELSFAQVLREDDGHFVPASNTISPPDVKGKGHLHFSDDFSSLHVKLEITGYLTGDQAVTLAHIHLDDATKTGPLTVELYPNPHAKVKSKKGKSLEIEIDVTNDLIIPRDNESNFATNSVASLYSAILGRNLYLDVHGDGDYLLGMIRGQIF